MPKIGAWKDHPEFVETGEKRIVEPGEYFLSTQSSTVWLQGDDRHEGGVSIVYRIVAKDGATPVLWPDYDT